MFPTALPEPELFLEGTGEPSLRWGVVGPGWIAGEFASALRRLTQQQLTAVTSRSPERGAAFAAEHGVGHVFTTVEQMAASPEVDVVYIATPPAGHVDAALTAIAGGKHVLIEKPFTVTADEARRLVEAGRAAGVLVMEALWSRYLPGASVMRTLLADGVFGDILNVQADHGQRIPAGPDHRLYRRDLGGGALLDLGIYPVQFASMVLGRPRSVVAVGGMTDTGVDAYATLVQGYDSGAQATLTTTMLARTPVTACIAGTDASLLLDPGFYQPRSFTLTQPAPDGAALRWDDPSGRELFDGLSWEATALARFVGEGRLESPVHTLDETVSIMETLDEARAQVAGGAHE